MKPEVALARLIAGASRNVPLYRRLWGNQTHALSRSSLPEQLAELPVLTKSDLLGCPSEERLDSRYAGRPLRRQSTSGSTGQPLDLLLDPATHRRRQIRFLRALWNVGYRPGQKVMLLSSRPAHSVKTVSPWARFVRWTYADLYLPETELVDIFRRTRPHVLYGPVSALVQLARAGAGSTHQPRVVISTSEQATPSFRRLIKLSFGADVTDFYGMTEVGLIAWQLRGIGPYRTATGDFILEFLPSDDPSGLERLVVTDLGGGAMPLIRYDTGDLVRRDHTRADKPITAFSGKQYDFLRLPDGSRISPYLVDEVLGELPGVLQFQVIQQPDLSLDLRLAATSAQVVQQAMSGLDALCGGRLAIRLEEVPVSHTLTAHKLRPVQSLVRDEG